MNNNHSLWYWINSHPKRYIKIIVDKENNNKYVELHDPVFVGKTFKMSPTYSLDYPTDKLMIEAEVWAMNKFGYKRHSFWGL